MIAAHRPIRYDQYDSGDLQGVDTEIVVEMPLSVTVNGETWVTLMSTPVDQEALAVGFLFNEGLIQSTEEISDVRLCPTGDNVDVWLTHDVEKPTTWRRTSGCTGGVTSVESVADDPKPVSLHLNGRGISPQQITSLLVRLFESQDLYRQTGGVHTSALCSGEEIIVVAEDIGRHNTLDKLAGKCLLNNIMLDQPVVITTGRISSDMMQKSNRLGASIVISRTSPSSLSIELAEQLGITLIGYTRRNRFNIYTHPGRVLLPAEREDHVEQTSPLQTHSTPNHHSG